MMTKKNEYKPEYLVSPGEVLVEYIEGYDDLVEAYRAIQVKTGINPIVLGNLCDNTQPITPAIALKLEKLGRPAHFWINLERQYQEDRARLSGISQWRKVEDEEPPKDGNEFVYRHPVALGELVYILHMDFFGWWCDSEGAELFEELKPCGRWMPIPGGE